MRTVEAHSSTVAKKHSSRRSPTSSTAGGSFAGITVDSHPVILAPHALATSKLLARGIMLFYTAPSVPPKQMAPTAQRFCWQLSLDGNVDHGG